MISKYLFITLFFLWGCGLTTVRPKEEMSFAQAAFLAAKEAKADVRASQLFRKAELLYFKAKSSYKRKYFNKAKEYALESQKYSELAEFEAEKKQALGLE